MDKWLDFSKHNAALWVDDTGLVLEAIDKDEPFYHVNADDIRRLLGSTDHQVELDGDGFPRRVSLSASFGDADCPSEARWMQVFTRAVRRPIKQMAVPFPPLRSQAVERALACQFLWRVDGLDPESLDLAESVDGIGSKGVAAFALTEEQASFIGSHWSSVEPKDFPLIFGKEAGWPDTLWGVVGEVKDQVIAKIIDTPGIPKKRIPPPMVDEDLIGGARTPNDIGLTAFS